MTTGRQIDVQLQLLDRQIVDRDGRLVAKVDDLEFSTGAGGELYVTAILIGPRALGPRLGGRFGRWVVAIADRLSRDDPPRISFDKVSDIGSAVTIAAAVDDLDVNHLEDWVDDKIVSRIPGSTDAS